MPIFFWDGNPAQISTSPIASTKSCECRGKWFKKMEIFSDHWSSCSTTIIVCKRQGNLDNKDFPWGILCLFWNMGQMEVGMEMEAKLAQLQKRNEWHPAPTRRYE
jgi:hypothetical protein